jgi:hypothetical protein
LQQNTSFDGTDPLAPVSNTSPSVVNAQLLLFASLSFTVLAAFFAVLAKQWILRYVWATTWGDVDIVDRGEERQNRFTGLQKWRFYAITDSLPFMLQYALLFFGLAIYIYLQGLDDSTDIMMLVATIFGSLVWVCTTYAGMTSKYCPFQTPLFARVEICTFHTCS